MECPKCNLVLKNAYYLKNHKRSACERKMACNICGGMFRRIELHMRTMHTAEEDKKFHCSYCGKGFTSRQSFLSHEMNIHVSQKAFQCRYGCENRYNDQSNMFHHEKRHHGSSFKPASWLSSMRNNNVHTRPAPPPVTKWIGLESPNDPNPRDQYLLLSIQLYLKCLHCVQDKHVFASMCFPDK